MKLHAIIAIVFAIIFTSIVYPVFEGYSWIVGVLAFAAMYKLESILFEYYNEI